MHDDDARDKLFEMIKDIRFAMFTTQGDDGQLRSRPMTTQNRRGDDGALWFIMARNSEAVQDLMRHPAVNIAYADTDHDTYVSVSGQAQVVEDLEQKRRLWTPMSDAWFPQGAQDPNAALVRVDITHADTWDVKANKAVQLLRMVRASLTGQPPHMGERRSIDLH